MCTIFKLTLTGRCVHWLGNVVWLALTLLFEFGWGALMYASATVVPDVQVPLFMLFGIVGMLLAVALAGFAAIPLLVLIAVDEGIARLCTAKERA